MPRVTFSQKWHWNMQGGKVTIIFPAGYSGLITTEQYNQALAEGVLNVGVDRGGKPHEEAGRDTGRTEGSRAASTARGRGENNRDAEEPCPD